jgi:hypothetical protein
MKDGGGGPVRGRMRKTMMIVVSGGGGCGRQKLAQLTQLNLK